MRIIETPTFLIFSYFVRHVRALFRTERHTTTSCRCYNLLNCREIMVQLQRDSLNSLFDVLLEWETHLAQHDLSDLRCDDEHIRQ